MLLQPITLLFSKTTLKLSVYTLNLYASQSLIAEVNCGIS